MGVEPVGRDLDGRPRRRVLARVVQQHVDHFGQRRGIDAHRRHVAGRNDDAVVARQRFGARHRVRDDDADVDRSERRGVRRFFVGARDQPADETVQAVRFLVDDLQQLALLIAAQRRVAAPGMRSEERRHRRFDRGERRPEVVAHRVEQRRLQPFAAARRFRLALALERRLKLRVEVRHFFGSTLGARRELEADRRDDDEGDERRPVVRLAECEAARSEEVPDEGCDGENGGDERRTAAAEARGQQYDEQQHLRRARAVDRRPDELEQTDSRRDRSDRRPERKPRRELQQNVSIIRFALS